MATPKIKFFATSTRENVAYAMHGRGSYLVVPAWWVSHLELDWQNPNYQRFFQSLGKHHTIVRYDRPGVGLSDRQRNSFELEDEVRILTELIEHLAIENCSLLGISCGGPTAVEFANRYPHRVDRIVFIGSFVNGADIGTKEIQQALCSLVSASWGLGAKTIIDLFDPEMEAGQRRTLGKIHSQSSTAAMAVELLKLTFKMNASDAAKNLIKPALVLHRSEDKTICTDAGKRLAIAIPNAEFKTIEGKSHLPWNGPQANLLVDEILNFTSTQKKQDTIQHNQFRKLGDVWALSFADRTIHIKDALGLRDIAQLIMNAGKEIHVRSLACGETSGSYQSSESIEILDQQALQEYRQRLAELAEEKTTAAQNGDENLFLTLEQEEEPILAELNAVAGLAGKTRYFNSEDEKARKSVTARIRNSIKRIQSLHPKLGEHLIQSISTGQFCRYSSSSSIRWLT